MPAYYEQEEDGQSLDRLNPNNYDARGAYVGPVAGRAFSGQAITAPQGLTLGPGQVPATVETDYRLMNDQERFATTQNVNQAQQALGLQNIDNLISGFQTDEAGNQSYADLPVVKGADGYYYYDAAKIAEAEGMSPEAIAYLQEGVRTPLEQKAVYSGGDQIGLWDNHNAPAEFQNLDPANEDTRGALILRNLGRTRALTGAPLDLSNETHLTNLMQGNTSSRYTNADMANKGYFNVPDESHWYDPERIIPMATMAAMAAMSAGAGSAIMAPAATAMGGAGTLGGAALTGLGAGSMATLPSTFMNTVQSTGAGLDVGAGANALKEGIKAGIIGGGMGAVTAGGMNLAGQGLSSVMGSNEWNGIPMEELQREAAASGMSVEELQQIIDPQNFDLLKNMGTLQQLDSAGVTLGTGATVDVFGRALTDNPYDSSTEFDRISNPNDPMNQSQQIKDLYTTGNTETLSSLGFMTDSGKALGLEPSNMAVNDAAAQRPGMDYKSILNKMLGLYSPDQAPTAGGPTGLSNNMWQPSGNLPPMSGAQATGAGNGYNFQGSNVAQNMTQQYGAVRPSGMENYTQDLLSMVQENPDMLENPAIMNMIQEQLLGNGQVKRPGMGLEGPLNNVGMVV